MSSIPINIEPATVNIESNKYGELLKWKSAAMAIDSETALDKREAAKAARGFESMFVGMMMKEMKKAMLEEDEDESGMSLGADTLMDYSDLMFADQISQTGKGLGIAEMVYRQLTGDELDAIRVINQQKTPIYNEIVKKIYDFASANKNNILDVTAKNENKSEEILKVPVRVPQIVNTEDVNQSFIDRVTNRISNYSNIIERASEYFNIPSDLIKAVITTESAGKNEAKSGAGAKGLMQLMDGTAKDLGVSNSYDPYQNIMGGTKYLRQMLDKFGNNLDLALAAYNAGPGNVQKYDGIPPFNETQAYVKKVNKYFSIYSNENNY